jgi:hypothetical protein
MAQIPLRRAHRLRAITLASPTKKLRPQPTERAPTAWHTNDEYKNAEASEEASASSVVTIASENRILPIPTPVTGYTNPCAYKRVSSVGRFYDGLRATQWRAEGRRSVVEYRTREYLIEREVERLMEAAGNNRYEHPPQRW